MLELLVMHIKCVVRNTTLGGHTGGSASTCLHQGNVSGPYEHDGGRALATLIYKYEPERGQHNESAHNTTQVVNCSFVIFPDQDGVVFAFTSPVESTRLPELVLPLVEPRNAQRVVRRYIRAKHLPRAHGHVI